MLHAWALHRAVLSVVLRELCTVGKESIVGEVHP
jgi:hypothetical protein